MAHVNKCKDNKFSFEVCHLRGAKLFVIMWLVSQGFLLRPRQVSSNLSNTVTSSEGPNPDSSKIFKVTASKSSELSATGLELNAELTKSFQETSLDDAKSDSSAGQLNSSCNKLLYDVAVSDDDHILPKCSDDQRQKQRSRISIKALLYKLLQAL